MVARIAEVNALAPVGEFVIDVLVGVVLTGVTVAWFVLVATASVVPFVCPLFVAPVDIRARGAGT